MTRAALAFNQSGFDFQMVEAASMVSHMISWDHVAISAPAADLEI